VRIRAGDSGVDVPIQRFDSVQMEGERLVASVRVPPVEQPVGVDLRVEVGPSDSGSGVRIRCDARCDGEWAVESVRALDRALLTTDADGGATVLPRYLGLRLPADKGLPSSQAYKSVDSLALSMCGLVQRGSALLLTWSHPGITLTTHVSIEDSPRIAGRRTQCMSLTLGEGGTEFELHPIGRGDYVEIGRAYRRWVTERTPAPDGHPGHRQALAELAGAAVFRPFGLHPSLPPQGLPPSAKDRLFVAHTYDEAARCARHWREDLDIDRALVTVSAASPFGAQGIEDCIARIRDAGYLVGLHENYLDIVGDAPLDPAVLARDSSGAPVGQRVWGGVPAYVICGSQQPLLARRNWARIRALFEPDLVCIDTTLADLPQPCAAPEHPATRAEDLSHKAELLGLARESFASIACEGGGEWAVPDAAVHGRLLSQKTLSSPDSTVVPLFPIVYGDSTSLVTMQGDRVAVSDASKILSHLLYAAMPIYDVGESLYFKRPALRGVAARPEVVAFEPLAADAFRFTYRWSVAGDVGRDCAVFVHFIHPESRKPEHVSFQDDHVPPEPSSTWRAGRSILVGPRVIHIEEDLQGTWEVWAGLVDGGERVLLDGLPDKGGRYLIGRLHRRGGTLEFEPVAPDVASVCFARGDRGWAARLGPVDRLIKNSWEVLSWVQRMAHGRAMTDHRFLTPTGAVESTAFGDLRVTVNYGEEPYDLAGTLLPRFGFLVTSPTFEAFHATRRNGIDYPDGALFTLRGLDGAPLAASGAVRIFHGFGSPEVAFGGAVHTVVGEATILRRP
jgi:hypothetical protein